MFLADHGLVVSQANVYVWTYHALITLDGQLAHAVKDLVTVAPIAALS